MSKPAHLNPEIAAVLGQLRKRIRKYVLFEGAALVLAVAGLAFWLSFGLDWLYFSASSLELPRWFRLAFNVAALATLAAGFVVWIGIRWWRGLRMKSLALVLERRFPELNDQLVTAVESSEAADDPRVPLTAAMLHRTIDDASRAVSQLDLNDVFDLRPRSRAILAAGVLAASIAGLAITDPSTFGRWVRGYVKLEPHYWNRETELTVRVVAEPGDRIRDFKNFHYKHPRGADLNLIVDVPPGKKVPARVQLAYRLEGEGARGVGYFTQETGTQSFRYSVAGLLDSMRFEVYGGDYRTRETYFVEVVDPPRVDRIVLKTLYPDYTRLNRQDPETGKVVPTEKVVHGAQVSLPVETYFQLEAQCNKPLVRVRVETDLGPDRLELEIARSGSQVPSAAVLTRKSTEGAQDQSWTLNGNAPGDVPRLAPDGLKFTAPFHLVSQVPETLSPHSPTGRPAIPLPADSRIRLYLEDADEIESTEPIRLTVNGVLDQPPLVDTELKGIGTSITRKALIPVTGTITDDYGLAAARFEFRVDDSEAWQKRPFEQPLSGQPQQFRLARSASEPFERFEVLPLDLEIGHKLTLTVFAEDGDNLNGPHTSRGERYSFDIVSNEELLSILYAKELNLRRRFEQIITEIKQIDQDLTEHQSSVDEWAQLKGSANGDAAAAERLRAVDVLITASAERSVHGLNKNRGEMAAIEESFYDIREEMVNNAVHTRQMLDRIDDRILAPLKAINNFDFGQVEESLARFRAALQGSGDVKLWIGESIERTKTLVRHMEAVLVEMQKLETFQEALEQLKALIQQQDSINQKTKNERKRRLIESLK